MDTTQTRRPIGSARWGRVRWMLVVGIVAMAGSTATAGAASDPKALEIAGTVMDKLGGQQSWDGTRFVKWNFFGRRTHYWDKGTGNIRIESPAGAGRDGERRPERLILMNVRTKQGRVWEDGQELLDPDRKAEGLQQGHEIWINDSYWMFMPYKLRDPGVTLRYGGEKALEDGRPADVLDLTFDDVGYTPENRYEVYVARDTGRIEQWSFFAEAADAEPRFSMPWADWRQFGKIWLATNHGRDADWGIAVYDTLPESVFSSAEPVSP